jgi:hypothetical protein
MIVPYLNLINEETKKLNPNTVSSSWYHNIPKGAKNGLQNGLKLVLDVESFDYAYFPRGAKGFRCQFHQHFLCAFFCVNVFSAAFL